MLYAYFLSNDNVCLLFKCWLPFVELYNDLDYLLATLLLQNSQWLWLPFINIMILITFCSYNDFDSSPSYPFAKWHSHLWLSTDLGSCRSGLILSVLFPHATFLSHLAFLSLHLYQEEVSAFVLCIDVNWDDCVHIELVQVVVFLVYIVCIMIR